MFDSMRFHAETTGRRLVLGLAAVAGLAVAGAGAAGEVSGHAKNGQQADAPGGVVPQAVANGQPSETALEHAAKHLDKEYVCPMHSQVSQKEPGNCPLCGMGLLSGEGSEKRAHAGHSDGGADDPHAHHRAMMNQTGYKRSEHGYRLPDLALVGADGAKTSLLREVDVEGPVMLNFIFTTCTTICPVLSATFAQVQAELGVDAAGVRMISITIDPEHDTPERLGTYAGRFNAGDQWRFLTGDLDEIVAVQKAFDAYRGSKMNHEPLTFLRVDKGARWVRLNGLASASDVVMEYKHLIAQKD